MRTFSILAALVAAASSAASTGVAAQTVRRSQLATVSQMVGTTEVRVIYRRPVARGRTLFGDDGVVHWDRVWTPGADSATRVEFTRDVTVNGQPLAAGRYSLWMIPRAAEWTVIFSRPFAVFHMAYPGESEDAARFTVKPTTGAHMEALAFYFPVVEADSAVLQLHWGTTVVPMTIKPR